MSDRLAIFTFLKLNPPGNQVLVAGIRFCDGNFSPVAIVDVLAGFVDVIHPGIQPVTPGRVESHEASGVRGLPGFTGKAFIDQEHRSALLPGFDGGKTTGNAAADDQDIGFQSVLHRCLVHSFLPPTGEKRRGF